MTSGYKVVRKGQFAMNKMKAWQGSYGISEYTGIVSPAYFIFDVDFDNIEYFHYAIRSKVYVNFFAQASDGIRVGQWDLQMDKMKEIPFIVPSPEEQQAIVEYIPEDFAAYDSEIEKLQKIDLLLEQRISLSLKLLQAGLLLQMKVYQKMRRCKTWHLPTQRKVVLRPLS